MGIVIAMAWFPVVMKKHKTLREIENDEKMQFLFRLALEPTSLEIRLQFFKKQTIGLYLLINLIFIL